MALKTKLKVNKVIKFIKNIQILFVLYVLLFTIQPSFAASSYVLSYPESMPGSFFYKIDILQEKLFKYWYFGSFGQFFCNLKESDKYLVQSKTLFEYNQYLLAYDALKKSDQYFINTLPFLLKARNESKEISENREILRQAAQKHIEVLSKLQKEVPQSFTWVPEKAKPTNLNLRDTINKSIKIREKYL